MAEDSASLFPLAALPEFQRLRDANPQNPTLDALQAIMMYGRAIHWAGILEVLWPDFEKVDYRRIEAAYLTVNDPDEPEIPSTFNRHVANMIAMFWRMQLEKRYPNGKWTVLVDDDPEITVEVEIHSRTGA